MLKQYHTLGKLEAGCDEAGRGCLAGPVFAASVIFPCDFSNDFINDSKALTEKQRNELRTVIESSALSWAVAMVDAKEIDSINILNASFKAMNMAIKQLHIQPECLLIDGNRFRNQTDIPYFCIVKGDAAYLSIAAASILAKTYRDDYMKQLASEFSHYGWDKNKGYPTAEHRCAIQKYGITAHHRKTFTLFSPQLKLEL
ncbi:MAG: ribonuclease HII [Bacteroidales bacterium]|jgi:ribonuclease HII|nr:ribonuclease HII [Bacteroidales bacterium]